ncbi:MAG: alpha/beta hydrolase [Alphaproteobacteria bacterium]|jgi:lysophospholipase|nr:alpha/beta hydrolase [Alphaproteobacteria bacterium]
MPLVPPQLEERFLEPPGWQWGTFKNKQGCSLRFGFVSPQKPVAITVLLPGRNEYAEKYFEVARDLLKNDLAVWILEWQGQGLSQRLIEPYPQRCHSRAFIHHADDLHAFIEAHIKPAGLPILMLAHSMGANIGTRFLDKYPGVFAAAAMTSPMYGILAVSKIPAAPVVSFTLSLLAGKKYAFGQKDWSDENDGEEILSFDPVRSKIYHAWLRDNPELRSGGATFGWVYNAFASCRFLQRPGVLESIRTPCLIGVAGKEKIVDNNAIRIAASRFPRVRLLELPESGHEILMERDDTRNQFLRAFLVLVRENLKSA